MRKLEQAKALDNEKWRNNLGSEDENWLTLLCDIQARRARRVIKKLEAGKPVSCNRRNVYVAGDIVGFNALSTEMKLPGLSTAIPEASPSILARSAALPPLPAR